MERLKGQERQPDLKLAESARRALSYAQTNTYASGVHVGTYQVYLGAMQEVGALNVASVLRQNGIPVSRFLENFQHVELDYEMLQPTQEIGLTIRAKRSVGLAVQHAQDIKATEVTSTHLLIGVARYAEAARQELNAEIARREKEVYPFLIVKGDNAIFEAYKILSEEIVKREIPHASTISANPR